MSFNLTLDLGLGTTHTHAEDTPYTVQNNRVKNGFCPTCGAQVSKVKKSLICFRKFEPLTIPGKVDRGRCLVCHPTYVNERRRVKKTFAFQRDLTGEYYGEMDDLGRRCGYGTIRYSDGDSYEGEWKKDKREGHGEFTWSSGNVYVGGWRNGRKKGRGKYTFGNGNVREGRWRNGAPDGVAIYRYKNGVVWEEGWENGELVSEKKRWIGCGFAFWCGTYLKPLLLVLGWLVIPRLWIWVYFGLLNWCWVIAVLVSVLAGWYLGQAISLINGWAQQGHFVHRLGAIYGIDDVVAFLEGVVLVENWENNKNMISFFIRCIVYWCVLVGVMWVSLMVFDEIGTFLWFG